MKPCLPLRRFSAGLPLVAVLVGLGFEATAAETTAIPDADCLVCHSDKELTKTDTDGRTTSLFVDPARILASAHATNSCASCHADIGTGHPDDGVAPRPVSCATCHEGPFSSYGASVHGRALRDGVPGAAICTDCHGTHDILPMRSAEAPMQPSRLAVTCGNCHDDVVRDVQASVHGRALAEGRRDAPTCTDCHSEHEIQGLKSDSPIRVAEMTCSRCHASERINAKYRLPEDRVSTFLGSYHGLAARLGSTRAANCASCHGVHKILPSSDPDSTIHPSHLVATCGQCHPGATENFALGKIHVDENGAGTDLGSVVNRWVRRVYLVLIVVTIGVFAVHNGLLWWRKARAARLAAGRAPQRLTLNQRLQHAVLALSFILLAISGFALKFPDSWFAWLLGSDETLRRWTHRGAAMVMLLLGVYHLVYLAFATEGRRALRDLFPRRGDLKEVGGVARYAMGRAGRPDQPHSRFGYVEKLEYWAVVWGTVIMGVTGFMIWFPVQVSWFLPRWVIDVAVTIHYYEAILACLAILVWHFYHVIFDPDVYPLNWAFWDGRGPASPFQAKAAGASGGMHSQPSLITVSNSGEGCSVTASQSQDSGSASRTQRS
jgi:cytochrome b subunit of formate dehydrogenase